MYSYVPYATPIKALHHAHVYSPVAAKATFAPPCRERAGIDTDTDPNKDSLPGSHAPGIPGAPPIPRVKSACWRWIGQALPYSGRGEGFYEC